MAASVEDFVRRLIRTSRRFTFLFTEDFFNVAGKSGGFLSDRYRNIRRAIKHIDHRKGERVVNNTEDPKKLFDVEVVIVRGNFTCYTTTFKELAHGPFGDAATIPGFGMDLIDADKARSLVLQFQAEKEMNASTTITNMLATRRQRQLVLVAENPADLKRPSLEPIRALRSRLQTILINPQKGPIVDCQVATIFQEGNTSSFSSLMNLFCVSY